MSKDMKVIPTNTPDYSMLLMKDLGSLRRLIQREDTRTYSIQDSDTCSKSEPHRVQSTDSDGAIGSKAGTSSVRGLDKNSVSTSLYVVSHS